MIFSKIISRPLIVIVIAISCVLVYQFYFVSVALPAIRPHLGEVTDPILLPVLEKLANEVDINKADPKSRIELGMTYEAVSLNRLAEQTYQQYIELFPKRLIGWYRLAVVQERMGSIEEAIVSLQRGAPFAGPKMDAPHWQLALWLIDVGRIDEAREHIELASAINPKSSPVLIARGRLALEESKPDLAIEILSNKGLIARVPDGYVYQLLGRAYRAIGDEEKSREAWGLAGQSKPKWGDPWTRSVMEHVSGLMSLRQKIIKSFQAGDIINTRIHIEDYFSYEPENRVVRRIDAMLDLRLGQEKRSLQKLNLLIDENPIDAISMVLLAKARLTIQKLNSKLELAKTKTILNEVLSIDPENKLAIELLSRVETLESNMEKE